MCVISLEGIWANWKAHQGELAWCDEQGSLNYGALLTAVEQQMAAWRRSGVGEGDWVSLVPRNDRATCVAIWSLLGLNAWVVPLDGRLHEQERERRSNLLGTRYVSLESSSKSPYVLSNLISVAQTKGVTQTSRSHTGGTILLSSGTTGEPKVIVHSIESHLWSAIGASARIPLGLGDRWLWSLPPHHVSGFAILIRCGSAAATLVGCTGHRKDKEMFRKQHSITHLSAVPLQLSRLVRDPAVDLTTLRAILVGGSLVPRSLVAEGTIRGLPIHLSYGLTEMASQVATTSRIETVPERLHVGFPLPYRNVRLTDDRQIWVGGETLCEEFGHMGTARTILEPGAWFPTGDLGEWTSEGTLIVVGRMDNMFICGGENFYPEPIEEILQNQPDVIQAMVLPREDDAYGSRPVAIVDATDWNPAQWNAAVRNERTGFEVPVAYLPWPKTESLAGIKPSRRKMRQWLDEQHRR